MFQKGKRPSLPYCARLSTELRHADGPKSDSTTREFCSTKIPAACLLCTSRGRAFQAEQKVMLYRLGSVLLLADATARSGYARQVASQVSGFRARFWGLFVLVCEERLAVFQSSATDSRSISFYCALSCTWSHRSVTDDCCSCQQNLKQSGAIQSERWRQDRLSHCRVIPTCVVGMTHYTGTRTLSIPAQGPVA